MDTEWPINDRQIMTEVYTIIYKTGILTEDREKWNERPNVDKTWENLHTHFMDAQRKTRRIHK